MVFFFHYHHFQQWDCHTEKSLIFLKLEEDRKCPVWGAFLFRKLNISVQGLHNLAPRERGKRGWEEKKRHRRLFTKWPVRRQWASRSAQLEGRLRILVWSPGSKVDRRRTKVAKQRLNPEAYRHLSGPWWEQHLLQKRKRCWSRRLRNPVTFLGLPLPSTPPAPPSLRGSYALHSHPYPRPRHPLLRLRTGASEE